MRILDLFCGAGGASMGYHLAFPDAQIVGVDAAPQPNYPFEFHQMDVFDLADSMWDGEWDLIHASPPCHDHSTVSQKHIQKKGSYGTHWMLQGTADMLAATPDTPWVIENVEGATMPDAPYEFRLCGSSFLMDIRRHRKFITNFPVEAPPCAHAWQTPRFYPLRSTLRKAGRLSPVVGVHGHTNYKGELPVRQKAMGIDWMNNTELVQSIPPAFSLWISQQLLLSGAI